MCICQFLTSQKFLHQFCFDASLTTQTNPVMMTPDAYNCLPDSHINFLVGPSRSLSEHEGFSFPKSSEDSAFIAKFTSQYLGQDIRPACSLALSPDDGAEKYNFQGWPSSDYGSKKIQMGAGPAIQPKVWSEQACILMFSYSVRVTTVHRYSSRLTTYLLSGGR